MIFARFRFLVPLVIPALAGACGGGNGPRAAGPDIGAPAVPFRHKTLSEKRAFMAVRVEPKMTEVFQSFNAKAYGSFGCETCHGADMEVVDYRMPNSLYALSEKDTLAEAKDYDEETTKFMVERVVPAFAALVSEKADIPGAASAHSGAVTCFTCHPHE